MTIKQQLLLREFQDKVYSLDLKGLKELFERLKADPATDLSLLMFISKVYAEKHHNMLKA